MEVNNDAKLFEPVLDPDEVILKVYRPNKKRTILGRFLRNLPTLIIMTVFFAIFVVTIALAEGNASDIVPIVLFLVFFAIIWLLIVISPLTTAPFFYKNTRYALTNKRILIRSGIIGIDFKSLDYDTVGAITVNVSWIDKVIKKNTGSLQIMNTAAPMVNGSGGFRFVNVENPYDIHKEIKSMVDTYKNKGENK